jgi:xylobiose transport system permease protein
MYSLAPRKRSRLKGGPSVGRPGFVWAAPATIFFALFALVPLVFVVILSFTSWSGLGDPQFTGLDNWVAIFDDPILVKSLGLTVLFVALALLTQIPLSILLGVWAAGFQKNRAILSAIYFIPLLLSSAAISVLWRALLDPNFGIPGQLPFLFGDGNLFGNQSSAIGVLTFVAMWQFTPFYTLIFQGAARAIPPVLYQAAQIDGAGTVRQFFNVTLPQLKNSIVTSVILMVVGGLTAFDTVLILTNGGPGTDTTVTPFYMFQRAFRAFDFGQASAIAVVLVLAATAISLVLVRISGYGKMQSAQDGI